MANRIPSMGLLVALRRFVNDFGLAGRMSRSTHYHRTIRSMVEDVLGYAVGVGS